MPLTNLTKDDPDREIIDDKMVTMTKWGRNVKTRKFKPGEWTEECQKSFDYLKNALLSAPVLKLPDSERDYEIMTNASRTAVGAA